MMELSIGKGYGISLLSSRGFTSGVTKYSDSGIMLYRNASGYLTLNNVTKDNDGNISFSTDIATSSALYDFSMKQLRVDFIRSPTNVQIIVYGDWNRSSTLMSLTIAAGQVLPVPRGGFWRNLLQERSHDNRGRADCKISPCCVLRIDSLLTPGMGLFLSFYI